MIRCKFDLVIHDFPAGICLLSLLDKFNNPPMIFMTASADYSLISYFTKSASTPALLPHPALETPKSTFFGRIENFLLHLVDYLYYHYYIFPECDKIVATEFANLPPLIELAERGIISMLNYDAAVNGIYFLVYEIRILVLY